MFLISFFSTTFLLAISALFVFLVVFKKWQDDKKVLSLGLFWLSVSLTWFATFGTNIFWAFDLFSFSEVFAYSSYIFSIVGGPFLVYYLIKKSLNGEKLARFFFVMYILGIFVFLYFLFSKRLLTPITFEAGVKYGLDPLVFKIFASFFVVLVFFLSYDFFKRIVVWIKNKRLKNGYFLLSTVSIIVYMGAGFFEAGRLVTSWGLVFIKIVLLSSIFMAYLAYAQGSRKKQRGLFEV